MAHMLAASRGLGILSLHRASWKVGCKQKLFVVGRIHPATIKELPRPKPQRGHPHNTCLPRQFALNCALSDSSPPQSSQDDPVILSSKECPDGSILFVFGSPGQQVSEELAANAGNVSVSDNDDVCDKNMSQNGSATKEVTTGNAGPEVVVVEHTKLEGHLDLLSINDSTSKASPEVEKLWKIVSFFVLIFVSRNLHMRKLMRTIFNMLLNRKDIDVTTYNFLRIFLQ
ncbi:hypothetical protein L7F22_050629 [Adiantum nelumboides]|nr:hypothetical protein [Adiantum nelumboides]